MIKLDNFSSFFVANWKLNGNFQFIDQFIAEISLPQDKSKCVVICPTSIHLDYITKTLLKIFAQVIKLTNFLIY